MPLDELQVSLKKEKNKKQIMGLSPSIAKEAYKMEEKAFAM